MQRYDSVNQEIRAVAEEWVNRSKTRVAGAEPAGTEPASPGSRVSLSSIVAGVTILAAVIAIIFFAN